MEYVLNQKKIIRLLQPSLLWLSVLIHLLFFLLIYYFNDYVPAPKIEKEKSYYYYVPAYTAPSRATSKTAPVKPQKSSRAEKAEPQKTGEEKILTETQKSFDLSQFKAKNAFKDFSKDTSILTQANNPTAAAATPASRYMEAIHLIGDEFLDDPLRKILGRAITARLYYPDIARELHVHGVVSIGFTLHPSGEITAARIVKTSRQHSLDVAGLTAINQASPVGDVSLYVKEPRYLVVNIIF